MFIVSNISGLSHCVKSARIRSFSGLCFPAFGLNTEICEVRFTYSVQMRENTDQETRKRKLFTQCFV